MMTKKRISPSSEAKAFILFAALLSVMLVLVGGPCPSEAKTPEGGKPGLVPAALLKWPERCSPYAILVDKSEQKVFLYGRENLLSPERVYPCSTGENEGPKSRQNDRRTPEGIYFFTDSYVKRYLSPIYGIRAFPIDYPNPIDIKEGRDGYGIWFHGTNKPLKPRDTNGCIVLEDAAIDHLAAYIKLHETPTIICSKIEMADPESVKNQTGVLERTIEEWRRSWQDKDIDRYMSFYSPQFSSDHKDRHAWKAYKSRLAKQYSQIRVDIDDLRLLRNGHTMVAEFTQRYRASTFESVGVKRLYLQQNSEEWKIIGEVFQGEEKTLIASKKPTPFPRKEIRDLVSRWQRAWQGKDLETYISCYAPGFNSRGMDLRAWKSHRRALNRKYRSLEIDIRDLKIEKVSNRAARVTFQQDYRAGTYRDEGFKELFLVKKGRYWKIKKEEWQPLEKGSRL